MVHCYPNATCDWYKRERHRFYLTTQRKISYNGLSLKGSKPRFYKVFNFLLDSIIFLYTKLQTNTFATDLTF